MYLYNHKFLIDDVKTTVWIHFEYLNGFFWKQN